MKPNELDAVRELERRERQQLAAHPPLPRTSERPTIHWTELTPAAPGSRIATEWNFYLTQVGRLLAEGHEGKWVLIKGEECVGIFDTELEARQVRSSRFPLEDSMTHQIRAREPLLRISTSVLPVDVLIGMDVVQRCNMLVEGPRQQFTLDF